VKYGACLHQTVKAITLEVNTDAAI